MPILFSAVAFEKNIVARFASCDGNFMEIAEEVLEKIPPKNEKMTYSHGHYLLHYISDSELFYFCITSKVCQRSRAFLFLNEIKRRFSLKQGDAFKQVLCEEMYRYSEDYNTITIRKGELDELNSIGVGCSETLLGGKILLVNNPEDLRYGFVTDVGEIAQRPTLLVDAIQSEVKPNYLKHVPEDLRYRTVTCVEESTQTPLTEEVELQKNSKYFKYFIVTVILILIWLAMSSFGPISLVMVACICIFVIKNSDQGKRES